VSKRFWTGVAVAGCVVAGLAIFWPALSLLAHSLRSGLIAVTVTALILAPIYLLNRQKRR
jgi:hypothetical protein